nr:clip-associated protein [Quercus suber]
MLFGDHFKLHFNTAFVPSVVERLGDAKQPIHDADRRFLLTLMQVSSPFATPHLCLESQVLGLMDLPPPTLLGSLIWNGFDGSPTLTHHTRAGFDAFGFFFLMFSSLLPTHLSSNNNSKISQGTLQALYSTAMLFGDHFKLHFNTAFVPSVVERLGDAKQPIHDADRRFLLTLMQVSSPFATPHLCLESQVLGLMDLPPPTLLGSLIWNGFDGSPTLTHHTRAGNFSFDCNLEGKRGWILSRRS